MRQIKLAATAFIAVVSISVAAVPRALATEKRGEVVNKNGGAPTKSKFQGTSSTPLEIESTEGLKIKCTGTTVSGTITSKTTGEESFAYTGCTIPEFANCSTSGSAAKEIRTKGVTLKLVAETEQDYILQSFMEFTVHCGTEVILIKGSFLMSVAPEGKLIKTSERARFRAQGDAGRQTPEESTNHLVEKFGGKSFENASVDAEGLEVAFEEEVEFI